MEINDFEDLVVYKKARALAIRIYEITRTPMFEKDYRFCQQIRASVGSISDNIAEGFERQGNKEFTYFLYIAKGSCGEVRSQLNRALDVGYIDNDTYSSLYNDCKKLSSAILNFIKSIKSSGFEGSRYFFPSNPSNHSNPK